MSNQEVIVMLDVIASSRLLVLFNLDPPSEADPNISSVDELQPLVMALCPVLTISIVSVPSSVCSSVDVCERTKQPLS